MFRVKTRRVKRATSPLPVIPASPPIKSITDISGSILSHIDISGAAVATVATVAPITDAAPTPTTLMGRLTNFFEAESHAASTTKPWLRLERGLRLQKLRTFAESYPGLSTEEKENLNKALVKANDSKLLNTKQQLVYEEGKILSIRGLKIIRDGDPTHSASFKIEVHRQTKKRGTSDS